MSLALPGRVAAPRALSSLLGISGCAFLFESHVGVTQANGFASAWGDQSASALIAAQADPTKYPRFNASNAAFGGCPTLDWLIGDVAAVPFLETGALPVSSSKPITYIAAVRTTDVSAGRIVVNNRFPSTSFQENIVYPAGPGKYRLTGIGAPALDGSTVIANEVAILCAVAQPGTGSLFKNGAFVGRGALGTGGLDGVRIGASSFTAAGSSAFVGSIATIAGWQRELGGGEIARGVRFLMARYGLAVTL